MPDCCCTTEYSTHMLTSPCKHSVIQIVAFQGLSSFNAGYQAAIVQSGFIEFIFWYIVRISRKVAGIIAKRKFEYFPCIIGNTGAS